MPSRVSIIRFVHGIVRVGGEGRRRIYSSLTTLTLMSSSRALFLRLYVLDVDVGVGVGAFAGG